MGGYGRPPREELRRLEAQDRFPRVTYFEDAVGADMLDEEFFASRSGLPAQSILSPMPLAPRTIATAYLLRHRYQAIISWNVRLGLALAGLLKATGTRVPHIGMFSWISRSPKAWLLRRVHSHLDRIVLWSSHQRDVAIERLRIPAEKIVMLKQGVDTRFFRPLPDLAVTGICAVGAEMRDYPTLLRAMDGVAVPCHIAAGTKQSATGWNLQSALPAMVTVGRKNYVELRELYARSRFVVLPIDPASDTDNGITATLEAFAMGIPVIISRTIGQVDVVRHGETGLYVPPSDPRALREAVETLWKEPQRCRSMGLAARAYVEKNHRLEDFAAGVRRAAEEAAASVRPEFDSAQIHKWERL
jgi:glycosyltransferase involved in cell wall biosynthesis